MKATTVVRRTRTTFLHHLRPLTKSLLLLSLSTHADPNPHHPSPATIATSPPSDHISAFLRTTAPTPSWETLTATFGSLHLTHPLVEAVLLDLKEPPHAKKALAFFHWSSKRSPFYRRHSLRSYCVLVHILVRSGLLLDARALLESAILYRDSASGSPTPSLLGTLWSTYEAVVPGSRVFDLLVQTCSKMRLVDLAFDACSYFSDRGFTSSLISFNSMLRVAVKSSMNELAWKVFEYMLQRRVYPNQTTVETMISLMCKEGSLREMVSVVERIHGKKCAPSVVANVALVLRIVDEGRIEEGILLLKRMVQKNIVFDDIVHSLIIHSHCRMGDLDSAYRRREEMINKGCSMNAFVYTCFIGAHCDRGDIVESAKLMQEMVSVVGLKPYDQTYNFLIVGCFKTGRMEEGLTCYEKMRKDGFLPSSSTCNKMMGALCESRDVNKANELLTELINRGFIPNEETYLVLIDGYGESKKPKGC
uniref:Pentatricopeptide repeat-containing protein n=1 Tax=Ananas comosus var. bracteatus TaxID=296719 RepID=A0A6V7QIG8_ANACO|nr:unnamed protein product [Ananas comosus var. bracteatus]